MTTAELITRVRKLLGYDLDFYQGDAGSVSDAEIVDALNEAIRDLGPRLYIEGDAALTLTVGVAQYALDGPAFSRVVVDPRFVIVNGQKLTMPDSRPGFWAPSQFESWFAWRTAANGQLTNATIIGNKLTFSNPPAAVDSASVAGILLPLPLSAGTPAVALEANLDVHHHVAMIAACNCALPTVIEGQQMQRLSIMQNQAVAAIDAAGKRTRSRAAAAWMPRYARNFTRT